MLIKSLPININIELNKKEEEKIKEYINNNQVEPIIEEYMYEYNKYLIYYNNFQIFSEEI